MEWALETVVMPLALALGAMLLARGVVTVVRRHACVVAAAVVLVAVVQVGWCRLRRSCPVGVAAVMLRR
ncbi:MAG: hypothetical protein IPJ65_02820 [Archangiaceae bacterium]|nr:hypothetical protein [Archangiaceae bacterium]